MKNSIHVENIVDNISKIKSMDELRELTEILSDRYKEFSRRKASDKKLEFNIGDKVKLQDKHLSRGKADSLYNKVGEIEKLNPTKAKVNFEGHRWSIPYTMLEKERIK